MGAVKGSEPDSDRAKWDMIYAHLKETIKNQQREREILEELIKRKHEKWASNCRAYEANISALKSYLEEREMELAMKAAKSELMVGLKHRDAEDRRLKLEETEDELVDFRALFDHLTGSMKSTKEPDEGTESRRRTRSSTSKMAAAAADTESERLKLEYEKLASEKDAAISMLSKEKTFVWNQFNMLESKLTKKLKGKQAEVDKANEKVAQVLATVEQLQCSNKEKDETIEKLKEELQSSSNEKDETIEKLKARVSELSQELEGLKKKSQVVVTPVLRSCTQMAVTTLKKESTSENARPNGKGSRSSKRKGNDDDALIILGSPPKLFTSAFRVPKLKNSSIPAKSP